MSLFDVTLEGVAELERDWAAGQRVIGTGIRRGVVLACSEGAEEARAKARFKNHTGNLRRSIRAVRVSASQDAAEGLIVADSPIASYVEEGTKAHDIWPKAGQGSIGPLQKGQSRRKKGDIGTHRVALRFMYHGRLIFRRMVHHKGSRPYPFMGIAYIQAERTLVREIEVSVVDAQKILDR